jgi:hypothetical protein
MLLKFFKKQKEIKKKKELIKIIVISLNIPDEQKELYIESLEIVDDTHIENLYIDLTKFTEKVEIKNFEDINKSNFTQIAWLKKKEAIEKQKELNAFSFLIHNL